MSEEEAAYIDRQQGETCVACGANLRSIALANAIRSFLETDLCLGAAVELAEYAHVSLLEVNEAGNLTPYLKVFQNYQFEKYPEVDIHNLPYGDGTFDLVVHSDTLEHVLNPVHALIECRRVLRPGGAVCFTVPLIVGRMSRSRAGLKKSYHGNPQSTALDYMVQTEFGADAWTFVLKAGFSEVTMYAVQFPAGLAFLARN
ncbi:MAG: methyltransferase domain-containing protein [Azonexus sp.]